MARMVPWLWAALVLAGGVDTVTGNFGKALVGPGALATRGGGAQRSQGFGYVNNWPAGFFIAGSSIYELNGLYEKTPNNHKIPHAVLLTYENKRTGWSMMYINAEEEGYLPVQGGPTEWLLMDTEMRDRFAHKGGTYIPGAGKSWSHLHRPLHTGPYGFQPGDQVTMRRGLADFWEEGEAAKVTELRDSVPESPYVIVMQKDGGDKLFQTQAWRMTRQGRAEGEEGEEEEEMGMAEAAEDDLDELPWQVVAVMSEERMGEFLQQERAYDKTVQEALAGNGLPFPAPGSTEKGPPLGDAVESPAAVLCRNGLRAEAFKAFEEELAHLVQARRWRRAVLFVKRAVCKRRGRDLNGALADTDAALVLYPQYAEALFERALVLLDFNQDFYVGDPIKLVRKAPGLWEAGDTAVVIGLGTSQGPITIRLDKDGRTVHSQSYYLQAQPGTALHGSAGGGTMAAEVSMPPADHYAVLGVPADFSEHELRQAFRQASRENHPDKGGSADAMANVARAYDILSNPEQRKSYDEGTDLPSFSQHAEALSLREQVERRYFPEARGFWLFGDPLEKRREEEFRVEAERARVKQREDHRQYLEEQRAEREL